MVQNWRTNGKWGDETVEPNTWTDAGQEFTLTFEFTEEEIMVYSGDGDNEDFITQFSYQSDMGHFASVQVWDDVDYVNEIIFRYHKNKKN